MKYAVAVSMNTVRVGSIGLMCMIAPLIGASQSRSSSLGEREITARVNAIRSRETVSLSLNQSCRALFVRDGDRVVVCLIGLKLDGRFAPIKESRTILGETMLAYELPRSAQERARVVQDVGARLTASHPDLELDSWQL